MIRREDLDYNINLLWARKMSFIDNINNKRGLHTCINHFSFIKLETYF